MAKAKAKPAKLPASCKTKTTVYRKKDGRVVACTGFKLKTCFPKKKPQAGITKAAKEACAGRHKEYRTDCQKDYMTTHRTQRTTVAKPRSVTYAKEMPGYS